jgi:hypothetical protein
MGDVIQSGVVTTLDIPADTVLAAATGKLVDVMVIGFCDDGSEYAASSTGDLGKILVLLEHAKAHAMASIISVPD